MRIIPNPAGGGITEGLRYRESINHEIEDRNKSLINYANHMYEIAATAPGLSEEARNAYAASAANAMQATGARRGKYGETLPNQNPFRGTDTNWNNTPIKQWMNNQNSGGQPANNQQQNYTQPTATRYFSNPYRNPRTEYVTANQPAPRTEYVTANQQQPQQQPARNPYQAQQITRHMFNQPVRYVNFGQ